jgi:hypothetical protein
MGFMVKTTFWLGIVYYAMPLGELPIAGGASEVGALVCSPANSILADRLLPKEAPPGIVAAGCAAIAEAHGGAESLPGVHPTVDSRATPPSAVPQSLATADRRPPSTGHERRAAPDGPTQSWRGTHPAGYKRVVNSHPERQTVDD